MNVADVLKQLRKARNLTQQQLAEAIGMTPTAYQRYEQGTRTPTLDKLVMLANFYDTTLDYIAGRTDDPARH